MNSRCRETIRGTLGEMPAINHHEHAWTSFSREEGVELDLPHFLWGAYLGGDLTAAGLQTGAGQTDYLGLPCLPDDTEAAWALIRPGLERVRNTSYYRYLLRALRDLYDITEQEILSAGWREASERIRRYSREQRGRGAALCARMGVRATVLDGNLGPARLPRVDADGHTILHVVRLDAFIHPARGLAQTLVAHPAADLEAWLAAFDEAFRRSLQAGAVGFKSGLAYNRRIEYGDPSPEQVARIFKAGLLAATPAEQTVYQDFMMNRLCRLCSEAGVPLQIHTGLQAGLAHALDDSRPTLLTGLLRRFGDLRVDLFHGGYPWYAEAGLLAKYLPNVYIDGCWLSHISPSAYRAALTSWIETVPGSKILAWGGDHRLLEHSYASLALAKDLIADVLADMVERDYFDVEFALELARRMLHDNGAEFWRLDTTTNEGAGLAARS